MAFMLTPWFSQVEAHPTSDLLLRIMGALLGVLGAPASLIILFGMMAFCVGQDNSATGIKTLWFLLFFVTAPFGAALYFFAVYKKDRDSRFCLN